jgi:hypothetical protein
MKRRSFLSLAVFAGWGWSALKTGVTVVSAPPGSAKTETIIGSNALASCTSGWHNIEIGRSALYESKK